MRLENVRRVAVAADARLEDPLPVHTTIQAGLNSVNIEIDAIIGLSREDARS